MARRSHVAEAVTRPILDEARARLPRRVAHFQGDLSALEVRVADFCDGSATFELLAARLGMGEREVFAIALALAQRGAIVLCEPQQKARSGERVRVRPGAAEEEIEVEIDLSGMLEDVPAKSRR